MNRKNFIELIVGGAAGAIIQFYLLCTDRKEEERIQKGKDKLRSDLVIIGGGWVDVLLHRSFGTT